MATAPVAWAWWFGASIIADGIAACMSPWRQVLCQTLVLAIMLVGPLVVCMDLAFLQALVDARGEVGLASPAAWIVCK